MAAAMEAADFFLLTDGARPDDDALIRSGMASALADDLPGVTVVEIACGEGREVGQLVLRIAARRPTGVVIAPPLADFSHLGHLLRQGGCRYVTLSPDAREGPARLLCTNDRQGMCDAANYLIALGHRRIGFIAGPDGASWSRERELGWLDALSEHDLDLGAEIVAQGDGTIAGGQEAGRLLLAVSPRPTAVLAATDAMAAGVMQVASLLGLDVPGSLSVMGFGDSAIASALAPPLTTMRLPLVKAGFNAAIKLLDPARAASRPVELLCELVVRHSTGPTG